MSYPCTSERLTKSVKIIIFQSAYFRSGLCGQSLSRRGRHQVGTHPGQDPLPSLHHSPHNPALSLRLQHRRHDHSPNVHISGMWEETEYPEKTHPDRRRRSKCHTDGGPRWNQVFFSFSPMYNKMKLHEPMLFKNVLYIKMLRSLRFF